MAWTREQLTRRVERLERHAPPEPVHARWIVAGPDARTSPGGQHAERICAQTPIRIVWLPEDDHPAFYPLAPCWCGRIHQTPF